MLVALQVEVFHLLVHCFRLQLQLFHLLTALLRPLLEVTHDLHELKLILDALLDEALSLLLDLPITVAELELVRLVLLPAQQLELFLFHLIVELTAKGLAHSEDDLL